MHRAIALLLLFSTTVYAGGYVNPDFAGKKYYSVLVSVPVADLELRDSLEKAVAKEIRGRSYLSVFSPAKQYSEKEIVKILQEQSIDAVLVVNTGGVEDQSMTGGAMAQTHNIGGTNFTTVQPVRTPKKAIAAALALFDVATGQSAWVGNAKGSGTGYLFAKDRKVISRLAEDIGDQLRDSRLIR